MDVGESSRDYIGVNAASATCPRSTGPTDIARGLCNAHQEGAGRTEPLLGFHTVGLDDLEDSRLEGLDGGDVVGEPGVAREGERRMG